MDYYSNMKPIFGNTSNIYQVGFPYSKDNKTQYLISNKLFFRILEFYFYENDFPEISFRLSPKEVRFMCLCSATEKKIKI